VTEPVQPAVLAALDGCGSTCHAWSEQDEGPYHRADAPVRRDVVAGAPGAPLVVGIRLADEAQAPLAGATVEIWQCDALGRYSGFPPPEPAATYVPGELFLRGAQVADDSGAVELRTVYPGWYPRRTVHIHLRVHAGHDVFTSQLYFPEAVNDAVLGTEPYASRPGRDTTNESDSIASTGGGPAVVEIATLGDAILATTRLQVPATDGAG
jgi:protocatechuate 3,4-dioxygenase beta subunit